MNLNLIQRAAERLADASAVTGADDSSVKVEGTERREELVRQAQPRLDVQAGERPVASAPGFIEPQSAVHLDFAELRRSGMITPDNIASQLSNEFRRVKRELLRKARSDAGRALANNLVMVTSSQPREGKTFTAFNLAMSLAIERDVHVLLIDGDPVRPTICGFFENPAERGLLDVLAGKESDISEVIHRCEEAPNLSVVFAGTAMTNAPELMASRRMADLCVDLSTRYPDRMIIIDTPPVLSSAEPGMIAMHMHQLVMVVAAERTDRADVQSALDQVSSCRNVGLLLNKAPTWSQLNRGSYYSYYKQPVTSTPQGGID